MIKCVLFDIDGTLIRTGGAGVKSFAKTSEHIFGLPGGIDGMSFAGRTDTGLVQEFLKRHGLSLTQDHQDRFLQAYTHFLAELLPHCVGGTCEGVRPWIQSLLNHPSKPRIGLLTGNIRLGAELKLRHHQLWGIFEVGVFGDDHPDRNELARIALQRCSQRFSTSLKGQEILVIGDTPLDIACANAIGAASLAVATGGHTLSELSAFNPTLLASQLDELSIEQALDPWPKSS